MAYLQTASGPAEGSKIELSSRRCVLGRNPDCDVVVEAESVSRHHARILMLGRHFYVEDLNSSNGTVVNNEVIHGRIRLNEGDKIRLSRIEFDFHETLAHHDQTSAESRLPDQHELIDEDLDDGTAHDTDTYIRLDGSRGSDTGPFSTQMATRWGAMLEITQALGQFLTLDRLLPKVLDSLFKMLPQSERGCVILKDEAGQLRPGWVKVREGELRISRTVINDAMTSLHAVISRNAVVDPRYTASQSVTDLQLRSVMCAPLIDMDGEAIGVVQVDTSDSNRPFQQEDLEILVAVATQTAIAITAAQLHEKEIRSRTFERDLALAMEVQRNCLPEERPRIPDYEFFDYYEPAEQIGGDYFDYIPLPDGRLGIVIGDVVGHGVPAALIMSKISAETRFLAASISDPAAVLAALNGLTCRSNRFGRFITLLVMVLDPQQHELTLAAAGHMPPLLRRRDGSTELPGREGFGPPLGAAEDTVYQQHSLRLEQGDSVVLYTDGVTDARNKDDQIYGDERLADVVAKESTPQGIGERLHLDVAAFIGKTPREDDLCVVCFGRR